jgi:diguanylate cyclase (GGDEF)-like protein
MKLRHILVITFCFIVTIPMTLFWVWPYSKALDLEVKEVNQKHLVIAKNLSAAFERYYQDVTGLFSIIDNQSDQQVNSLEFKKLLGSYKFTKIVLTDIQGNVSQCIFSADNNCLNKIDSHIIELAQNTVDDNAIQISTVTEDTSINSGPILLVVKKIENNILLGYLSTDYIVEMGKRVAFGKKGHAAIVDQAGNVLAHPLDIWIEEMKDASQISVVQKMMTGQTGVEKFYSPALKGDMIAGYTSVPNAGWGVMVPQPIEELEVKASTINQTAILVMFLGLGLACLIAIPVSFIVIKPIENLLRIIKLIESKDANVNFKWSDSKIVPQELRALKSSFSQMMDSIEANKKVISKLAYFDSNTGLPNRNNFYRLSHKALDDMAKYQKKGAFVFIDFDGFKAVNDTYGHRVGDELLSLFGGRLIRCLSLDTEVLEKLLYSINLPNVIPARLGGDEFVILLKDITTKDKVELKIQTLFDSLFAPFELSEGIKITLTGSAGIALYPENGVQYDQLMRGADLAMYQAKSSGLGKIKFAQ